MPRVWLGKKERRELTPGTTDRGWSQLIDLNDIGIGDPVAEYTYNGLGRVSTVTQHNNDDPASGDLVDQVKYTYDDRGNIEKFEQDHNSDVGGGGVGDYETSYA